MIEKKKEKIKKALRKIPPMHSKKNYLKGIYIKSLA
jgi:hypothetical protein